MSGIDEARCAGCGSCPAGALMLDESGTGNKDADTGFSQSYGRGRGMGSRQGKRKIVK